MNLGNLFGVGACTALLFAYASPAMADLDGYAFTPVEADNGASGFSVVSIAISNLNQIAITTDRGLAQVSGAAPGSDPTRVFSQVTAFESAQQQVNGINAAHQIVGFFDDAPQLMGGPPSGGDGGTDGFVTFVDGATTFPTLILVNPAATANVTQAFGINDHGVVAGAFQTSADGRFHGFSDTNGVYTTIDVPGAVDTFAQGINNDGDVVGYYEDASGVHGFIETGGVFTTLDVPGANIGASLGTFAEGINDEGEVVGYFDDSLGQTHGFIESGGLYTTFDAPLSNAGTTKAFGINDAGDIVGLDDFTESELINGMVVAGSTITNGFYATPLQVEATPAPPSWTMMLAGLAGLGLAAWRTSRRAEGGSV